MEQNSFLQENPGEHSRKPVYQTVGASLPRVDGPAARQGGERAPRGLVREDYSHVISDLKRIGTIAGALLAIMLILSFVLPQIIR